MSDAWRDSQFDGQHVELLPARTVLSTFARATESSEGSDGSEGMDSVGGLVTHLPLVGKVLGSGDHGGSNGVGGSAGGSSGLS